MAFNSFLNNSIKILLVLLISIMLIIGTIFVQPPSFASTDDCPNVPQYTDFDKQYLYLYMDYNAKQYYIGSPNSNNVFLAIVKTAEHELDDNQDTFSLYAFSTDSSAIIRRLKYSITGGTTRYDEQTVTPLSDNYFGLSIDSQMRSLLERYSSDIPVFESFDDLFGSLTPAVESFNKTVAVEAGYVAYILCDGGYADFTTTFSVNSNLFNGGWLSNQRYGYSSSRYPDSGTTFTTSYGNAISWQKLGTADKNILGQTKSAYFTISSVDSSASSPQYLVVYNPAYNAADDVNYEPNPTIYVHCSNLVGANKFKLLSSIGINDTVSAIDPDDYVNFHSTGTGSEIIGDGDSLYWYEAGQHGVTSTESAITYFPAGGYNDYDTDNSYESVLNGLVQKVVNLLSAPVDHIKNLINAGQEFMSNFSNLYSWLPEPVLTVLTSALALVVVIGVIKLLH